MSTLSMDKFRAGLFAAIVAAAPLSSQGQDPGVIARVNVPFGFETGTRHFAAGVYTLRLENGHSLLIRGISDSGLALASIEDDGTPAKTGKAVFRRYGSRYFLRDISIAGKSRRLHLQPTKEQARLENAAQRTTSAPVEIALSTER